MVYKYPQGQKQEKIGKEVELASRCASSSRTQTVGKLKKTERKNIQYTSRTKRRKRIALCGISQSDT